MEEKSNTPQEKHPKKTQIEDVVKDVLDFLRGRGLSIGLVQSILDDAKSSIMHGEFR